MILLRHIVLIIGFKNILLALFGNSKKILGLFEQNMVITVLNLNVIFSKSRIEANTISLGISVLQPLSRSPFSTLWSVVSSILHLNLNDDNEIYSYWDDHNDQHKMVVATKNKICLT